MIIQDGQKVDTGKTHRKQGGAFDTLSKVLRNVTELFFRNDLVMRNRPSEITDSKNVFEMYVTKNPKQGKNYFFIGRSGIGADTQYKNVNYIELFANADTTQPNQNNANGQIVMRMSEDQTELDNGVIVGLVHGRAFADDATGIRAMIGGKGDGSADDLGGAQVAYYENGALKYAIVVDKDGIQMSGLPTSASGLASGAIWRNSTTLQIVP